MYRIFRPLITFCLSLFFCVVSLAQVPTPNAVLGFTPGDDYKLADYGQLQDYFKQLAATSDRVQYNEIGKSVQGRPLMMLYISSAKNIKNVETYRKTSETLGRARVDEATAQELSQSGKAIVWVDGGLHATEVAGAQMTPTLAHRIATEESAEMQKIRENCIVLLMPVMNPDGLDIVASWYKQNLGTPFETTRPPWLYHFYVGHDNNRDWFMNNMPESEAVTRTLYTKWYPQIVYNHHQTGPSWTRIFVPPFADPVNPNIHPGVTSAVNILGSSMSNRFAIKNMPGAVSGVIYSMWWNGGMRTVPYFHNMLGLLTETSHASATPRYYDPKKRPKAIAARRGAGHPTNGTNIFYPYPWEGGESKFEQPVNYMITATMAVLRSAADQKENFLYNFYRMGRDAIEGKIMEGPFAWVVPADQWNQGEEVALMNVLEMGGIEIEKANKAFTTNGKTYKKGSFVIKGAQAFKPYAQDLLEKQEYPVRMKDGKPERPYDLAGWTLPMQMGVQVDRIEESFKFTGTPLSGPTAVTPGTVSGKKSFGYALSHKSNASIKAVNQLLAKGAKVYMANKNTDALDPGTFVIETKEGLDLDEIANELGVNFAGIAKPSGEMKALKPAKIGIYKSWRASMDEGWTRWLLEEYEFSLDTLHDADIQSGNLSAYNAIILPSQSGSQILHGHAPGTMPDAYTGGLGLEGTQALQEYVKDGGRIVALDAASDYLIDHFGLPIQNATKSATSNQFFIPGSLIRININTEKELGYGMEKEAAASFVRSRAFRTTSLSKVQEGGLTTLPDPPKPEVNTIATYASEDILMSGWAMGEKKYLAKKAAVVQIPIGDGDVVLFGFRPQFRGQPRGTYKLFFNTLLKLEPGF